MILETTMLRKLCRMLQVTVSNPFRNDLVPLPLSRFFVIMAVATGACPPPFHIWPPNYHEAVELLCAVVYSQ